MSGSMNWSVGNDDVDAASRQLASNVGNCFGMSNGKPDLNRHCIGAMDETWRAAAEGASQ